MTTPSLEQQVAELERNHSHYGTPHCYACKAIALCRSLQQQLADANAELAILRPVAEHADRVTADWSRRCDEAEAEVARLRELLEHDDFLDANETDNDSYRAGWNEAVDYIKAHVAEALAPSADGAGA